MSLTNEKKEEIIRYVSSLLTGEERQWPETPELIIPDDIDDSIVNLCTETDRGTIIGTLWLGELANKPYYPNLPEWREQYKDPNSEYMRYMRGMLLNGLKKSVDGKLARFGMLKPVSVSLKKGAGGKYDKVSCEITYSGNGEPKTITAGDLQELGIRLEIELDTLMSGHTELYEFKLKEKSTSFKYIIGDQSAEEQERLWQLINMLVTGNEEEQRYAREHLLEMAYGVMSGQARRRNLIASQEKATAEEAESAEIFQGYMTQAIDVERRFTENSLAEKIGCSASTISRIRSGEIQKPRRNRVLQIGVALGLTPDKLRQFVRSSGNHFPISKADVTILDCLEKGMSDYNEIMYAASKYDAKLYRE